ncbi:MAG TPA: transposase [Candidatus Brocadiia bacterium]|nr:hypothetical protein [Candidatus Brocadiales bacterium]
MTEKYMNEYRIESTRLKHWDYSSGAYFITTCTKDRVNYFRDIVNGQVELTEIGEMAHQYWTEIPIHFPVVMLDGFIIMPNHVHGIMIIENGNVIVETQNLASLPYENTFGPQSKNLASIIRGYKAGVKKWATMNCVPFQWQPRFYEHIIRNETSLNRIREYITYNPLRWESDIENTKRDAKFCVSTVKDYYQKIFQG